MVWETPSFVEIDMSAEIGAYQGDFTPEFVTQEPTDAETEGAA
jgi:coenzyme PQQ precursor peptide PqqA